MDSKEIVGSIFGVALKIIIAIVIIMFVYKYSLVAYDFGYRLFGEGPISSGEGKTISVTIPSGSSGKEIGETLENKGLIRDADLFRVQERLSNYHGQIKAGEYELSTSMTAEEMIVVMATGVSVETETEGDNKSLDEITEEISNQQKGGETTVVGSKKQQ